jgi:plastocyanin
MAKRRMAVVGLAAVLAVGAATCSSKSTSGGGGDNPTQPPQPSASSPQVGGGGGASVLTVKQESNFTFNPDKFSVTSGDSITVQNTSSFLHTFTVDGQNIDTEVTAGTSARIAIGIPAGTYQFFCRFHGTATSGMHGTLTVN